jgi:hypothetical protein
MSGAVEFARSRGCNAVTCGHTHLPLVAEVDGVRYINSGTWTEQPPCPFVSLRGGDLRLEWWPIPGIEAPAEDEAVAEDPVPSDVEGSVLPAAR